MLSALVFVSSLLIPTSVSSGQNVCYFLGSSVGDPDPHVFGPPVSGSMSQRYGSDSRFGSFSFLIEVLSGLKDYLQNKVLTQNFSTKLYF
jgi:hypothetical protein